jgi:hypothetical protein
MKNGSETQKEAFESFKDRIEMTLQAFYLEKSEAHIGKTIGCLGVVPGDHQALEPQVTSLTAGDHNSLSNLGLKLNGRENSSQHDRFYYSKSSKD